MEFVCFDTQLDINHGKMIVKLTTSEYKNIKDSNIKIPWSQKHTTHKSPHINIKLSLSNMCSTGEALRKTAIREWRVSIDRTR
jgi:hypothetical protein